MSNCRPVRLAVFCVGLASFSAFGQSAATLEAVRLHRGNAVELAQRELAACLLGDGAADGGAGAENSASDAGTSPLPACAPKLSLLVGFLALSSGDAPAAVKQLSAIAAPPGLSHVHGYYLGEAQFYSRDFAGAAKTWERAQKGAPPWLLARIRTRLGEAYLAAGQPVQAAPLLEKAAPERDTPELYWQRALARRLVGNLDGERADLKTLALRFPAHPYAAQAMEKLAQQKKPVALTFDERLQRARGFLDAGDAGSALGELEIADRDKLPRGASAQAREALLRAEAFFAQKDAESAEKQLSVAMKGQASVQAEALMMRARHALKESDHKAATDFMAELDRRFPKEPAADEAGYLFGWLKLQDGAYADAVKAFDAFEKKHPTSHHRDEALWWKALAQILSAQYGPAHDTLEALAAFPHSTLVPQAMYWRTRVQQLAGGKAPPSPDALAAQYAAVMTAFPQSWYAVMAGERIRELGKEPPALFPNPPKAMPAKFPDELLLAKSLADVGLFRDAAEEAQLRLSAVKTPDQALKFGHALQAVGEFWYAHALAARLLWGQAYAQKDPQALALLYPLAWRGAVEREAEKVGVDPHFVWAIMRRESLFKPEVTSVANARGLMQLLPSTASNIARAIHDPEPDADELYSPELSIHLAAWYLKALYDRFGGVPLAAAAYNGGLPSAAKWLHDRPGLPMDLFVEEIPFKETRAYVKQVTADYVIYGWLYGKDDQATRVSLTTPEQSDGGVNF